MPDPAPARRVSNQYRRRRPLPALALIMVLGLIATIVWIRTLDTAQKRDDGTCGPPQLATSVLSGAQPQPAPGEVLPPTALDEVEPLPPDAVKVRVLNANGQRGMAAQVAGVLNADLGFGSAGEPGQDLVYPNYDLDCLAQIRFGEAGSAAGRTLSLVLPCAELVRDKREDDTVDLAIGAQFDNLNAGPEAKEILKQLTELAAQPSDPSGGQQGAPPASIDPTLITLARTNARC
jgi:hypothetical protein